MLARTDENADATLVGVVGLVRLNTVASDFDVVPWILRLLLTTAALIAIPFLVWLGGQGLRGEIFEGGVLVYLILLLLDLAMDVRRAKDVIPNDDVEESPNARRLGHYFLGLFVLVIGCAVALAVMVATLSSERPREWPELAFWLGLAVLMAEIIAYFRLQVEWHLRDELRRQLFARGEHLPSLADPPELA